MPRRGAGSSSRWRSGGAAARVPAAQVRSIEGLGPAVAVAQNVLNVNPASTVATSVGPASVPAHPLLALRRGHLSALRRAGAGASRRRSGWRLRCEMLATAAQPRRRRGGGARADAAVTRACSRDCAASSMTVTVDGRPWAATKSGRVPRLDPAARHDVVVRVGHAPRGQRRRPRSAPPWSAPTRWAKPEVRLGGTPVLRAPICPSCRRWVRPLRTVGVSRRQRHLVASHRRRHLARAAGPLGDARSSTSSSNSRWASARHASRTSCCGDCGRWSRWAWAISHSTGRCRRCRAARRNEPGSRSCSGGRLEDLLHVLDEPTIGLHHTDLEATARRHLVAAGPRPHGRARPHRDRRAPTMSSRSARPEAAAAANSSSRDRRPSCGVPTPHPAAASRRQPRGPTAAALRSAISGSGITGASLRNLRDVDCEIPLGALTVITGPSGAGKTTLARDVLLESIRDSAPIGCATFDAPAVRAVAVDQKPLGNNPRSNPATYTKVFDRIRDVFAARPGGPRRSSRSTEPKGRARSARGWGPSPSASATWRRSGCRARPATAADYRPEVLEATWQGRSIADVLELSVDEASALFVEHRSVTRILETLQEVGLGYVTLGQPSPSLSGGEAQRVRLTREVAKAKPGDLVLLDEPTTGLHPADLDRLLDRARQADGQRLHGRRRRTPGGRDRRRRLAHRPRPGRRPRGRTPAALRPARRREAATGDAPGEAARRQALERCHPGTRRPRPQPAERRRRLRQGPIHCGDRRFGLGQVVVGPRRRSRPRPPGGCSSASRCTSVSPCARDRKPRSTRSPGLARRRSSTPAARPGTVVVVGRPGMRSGPPSAGPATSTASSPSSWRAAAYAPVSPAAATASAGPRRRPRPRGHATTAATRAVPIEPRHLMGSPAAICPQCLGLGVDAAVPTSTRWVVQPDAPIPGCFRGSSGVHRR